MVVLYAIRAERDRTRIVGLLDLSTRTVVAMYLSLAAVVATGFWLGFEQTFFFQQPWYWWSIVLLVATSVVMRIVAKPFTSQLRSACEIRPSGVPRVSDDELRQTLRSRRTHVISAIGVGGFGLILYLMVLRPDL